MTKSSILIWILLAPLGPIVSAQTANLDELLAKVARWEYDESREPLVAVSDAIVKAHGSGIETREIETRLIGLLKSGATLAARDFACRQLSLIGSEASVPALSGMLPDPKTADMARYALERIPGPEVDRALREALAKTSGRTRLGIINTLGRRRDAASVPALRPLALGSEQATATAALFALAEIADPAAVQALAEAQGKSDGALKESAAVARLKAADLLATRGSAAAAVPIYKSLCGATAPSIVRAGALHGLATAGGAQSIPVLVESLRDQDSRVRAVAVRGLSHRSAAQLIAEIPRLGEAEQVLALGALAAKGDASSLPAFTAALRGSNKALRVAAIEGLASVGNASVVPALAGIAAGQDEAEQTAARASLSRLRGNDVDRAVVNGMASPEPKVKLELIRAAGERGTPEAAPVLLKMARDPDNEVRRESLRALRETVSAKDTSELLALVVQPVQAADRSDAGRALSALLRRSDPARIGDVVSAYSQAGDPEARASLMQVMGQSGNPQALAILRGALKDQDANLKRAAILALGDWPDAVPLPDLFETARTADSSAHQVLALRGALRLIGLRTPPRPPRETVKLLADAMSLAKQPEEKRSVLSLLPRFPVREALELAKASLEDKEVASEAQMAVTRLERTVRR